MGVLQRESRSHNMKFLILTTLACACSAIPQEYVPYVHQEIPAEPYIHNEIPAEPYVHNEPALTPEVLGNTVNTYAGPAVAWAGACVNSLGQGVPCRTQFRKKRSEEAVPYLHQEIPAEPYIHVEIPAEPYVLGNTINTYAGPAVAWAGAC